VFFSHLDVFYIQYVNSKGVFMIQLVTLAKPCVFYVRCVHCFVNVFPMIYPVPCCLILTVGVYKYYMHPIITSLIIAN